MLKGEEIGCLTFESKVFEQDGWNFFQCTCTYGGVVYNSGDVVFPANRKTKTDKHGKTSFSIGSAILEGRGLHVFLTEEHARLATFAVIVQKTNPAYVEHKYLNESAISIWAPKLAESVYSWTPLHPGDECVETNEDIVYLIRTRNTVVWVDAQQSRQMELDDSGGVFWTEGVERRRCGQKKSNVAEERGLGDNKQLEVGDDYAVRHNSIVSVRDKWLNHRTGEFEEYPKLKMAYMELVGSMSRESLVTRVRPIENAIITPNGAKTYQKAFVDGREMMAGMKKIGIRRSNGEHIDYYYYTPLLQNKMRSKDEVLRFRQCVRCTQGGRSKFTKEWEEEAWMMHIVNERERRAKRKQGMLKES